MHCFDSALVVFSLIFNIFAPGENIIRFDATRETRALKVFPIFALAVFYI